MITHKLIERIEGEAHLDVQTAPDGTVRDARVRFVHLRGMETVLQHRPALDALVIAPRVCGICGHSHLLAAAQAIESAYAAAGKSARVPEKARALREITRGCELIQNHLKWLYLVMLEESGKLLGEPSGSPLKVLYATSQINQISALFSGQWPHSSYALPGGVTSDPTHIEVMQALKLCGDIERFFADELLGCEPERFESFRSGSELLALDGDFGETLRRFERLGVLERGKSHGRLLVLGDHPGCEAVAISGGRREAAEAEAVGEDDTETMAFGGDTHAKKALYRGEFYETGPLARALSGRRAGIESLHALHGDAAITRITARIDESVYLLRHIRSLLLSLDLSAPSFLAPDPIGALSAEGTGLVEAPRGSLIHKVRLIKGEIAEYTIITPTQWNLGNGAPSAPGIAQKAMIGARSSAEAALLFRTFDVCSVCTTH